MSPAAETLADPLAAVAALADAHDRRADGAFPEEAWNVLAQAGVPAATVAPAGAAAELGLVRAVARADVSLGRLLDGHLNAVERLRVQVEPGLAEAELAGVRDGRLRLGVWGADPGPGEGAPAAFSGDGDAPRLTGVKTFCSGAGGLQRAFVLCRDGEAAGHLAYVDLTGPSTTVDRTWFRGAGMRGSASHRVVFDGAPVLWRAEAPGALLTEPWFSGDAIRTAASWAGGAERAAEEACAILRAKGATGDLEALAVARLQTACGTIDLWLTEAARRLDAGGADRAFAAHLRDAVASATREILAQASAAVGSRPFAMGGPLERARRDLETYMLQHRLEPILARVGRARLEQER